MEALSPLHGYSAVANQLIDLEDWGGNISLRSGNIVLGVENRESCRRCGALVFGMGNSRSGVGNLLLEWGFSFWCGQLSLSHLVWGVFGDATLVWEIHTLEWGICYWCGQLH